MNALPVFTALALCALSLVAIAQPVVADELYVKPGVAPGGTGTSVDDPLPTIQEAIDAFEGTRGYVFLHPGVYQEDVDIRQASFWFRPVERTGGVTIEGSFTIRRPGIIIRGLDFRSEGTAITLAEGAGGGQVAQCRITAVGAGHAGIEVAGKDVAGTILSDNIIDLRAADGETRTGIRVHLNEGTRGTRIEHNQIAGCETGIQARAAEGQTDESVLITGNSLHGNAVGLLVQAPGTVVRGNEFRSHAQSAVRVEVGPCLLDANTSIEDAVGFTCAADGIELTNSVIAEPRDGAIRVDAGDARIVHNTIHAGGEMTGALLAVAAGATGILRHNVLSGPGELVSAAGELSAFGNLYSHQADVDDEGALIGDPGFISANGQDFRLAPGSIAAHRADAVEVGHDAAGVGRPWGPAPSIGAYEVEGQREPTTWHVAAGAEAGDGSPDAPFGEIGRAIEHALPGDTVMVQPGEYAQGRVNVTRSGAPGAPITIRAATTHGAKMVETKFFLSNCSYVHIEGFDFTGTQFRQFINCGAYVRYCEFRNNLFTRTEGHGRGLLISGPGSSHNLIEGNRFALNSIGECRGSGCCEGVQIICQRHNWHQTIRGNDFSGCYYGVQTGAGSYPTAPPGYNLIEANVFHDNRADGVHTKSTDDIIRNNIFCRNGGHAVTTREGARIVIIGNWIYDNANGIRLHSPSHFVINNMICNNRGFGIRARADRLPHYEAPPELWIAHNTLAGNGRAAICLGALSGAHILRNIFVGTDPAQPAIDCETEGRGVVRQADSNLYYTIGPPLLREYEGGRYDIRRDPMFIDPERGDFRLEADSPARDMPQLGDALSAVLSSAPAGVPLPDHIGSNLGPIPDEQ